MKKTSILIAILLVSLSLAAQESRWTFGAVTNYNHGLIDLPELLLSVYNDQSQELTEIGFGVQVSVHFANKTSFRFGAMHAYNGYVHEPDWITSDGQNGLGDPAIPISFKTKSNFIDVPVILDYAVVKQKKYELKPSLGGVYSLYTKRIQITEMGDGSDVKVVSNDLNNRHGLAARVSLFNQWFLSEKVSIGLEPYFLYQFNQIQGLSTFKQRRAVGANISFNYSPIKKKMDS